MTTYFEKGQKYFYNMRGLIKNEPTFTNMEGKAEINFCNWDGKRIQIQVKTADWNHELIEEKITSSMNVVNKVIKKYGLQFTII